MASVQRSQRSRRIPGVTVVFSLCSLISLRILHARTPGPADLTAPQSPRLLPSRAIWRHRDLWTTAAWTTLVFIVLFLTALDQVPLPSWSRLGLAALAPLVCLGLVERRLRARLRTVATGLALGTGSRARLDLAR